MKKRILSVALLVSAWGGYSQVGIGTLTPDKSSQLDVTANNKGILIPRVSLTSTTDTTTITNGNVNSLLVFNTATQNDITPGYYYWYIDKWKRMVNDDEVGGNVYYDGDTFTYVDANGETQIVNVKKLVQANESQTVIITVDDQQYYVSEAYLAVNDGVVPTTVDPTAIPDGIYLIDVIGGVTNNFEEIYNNIVNEEITINDETYNSFEEYITYITESTGGFTKIVYDETTGDVIFQEWDEVTNTWENVSDEKFERIVQANESQTLLVQTTAEDKKYDVAEQYLQNNPSPNQTEIDGWDPTALPAGVYLIDVVGGIVNNIEEIVNYGPVEINDHTYTTIEEYLQTINGESSVKIVYDAEGDVIFQTWNETTNTWENVSDEKFERIVQANESQTLLVQTTAEDLQYYVAEQYLQNNPLPDQTEIDGWDPTALPAGVYLIDVVGGIVNNIEEIVNYRSEERREGKYSRIEEYLQTIKGESYVKIVYDAEGDVIFQTWNETTNTWENVSDEKFERIVQANESQTLLVQTTAEDLQYYVAEQYLQNNPLPDQTEIDGWDPTALPAGVYLIDVVGGIVNNIEEIVNYRSEERREGKYSRIEEYLQTIKGESYVKIVYDAEGDVIFQTWNETTNTW